MNALVLEIVDTYEHGGGYAWPAPKGTHGTTRDLFLGLERIARGTKSRGSHCSGLTFEVLWRALERAPGGLAGTGLDAAGARALMREWFVPQDRGRGPAAALEAHGLGLTVTALDQARAGDFLQFWTNGGRGHTAVFLSWVRDSNGAIIASRHWSSHPRTDGIGIRERRIGPGKGDIDRNAIYIGRAQPDAGRSDTGRSDGLSPGTGPGSAASADPKDW